MSAGDRSGSRVSLDPDDKAWVEVSIERRPFRLPLLDISETTDTRHGPLPVPFTFALLPDLTVSHIWNGWYFVGRPTPEELRLAAREITDQVRPDLDFRGD